VFTNIKEVVIKGEGRVCVGPIHSTFIDMKGSA